VPMVVGGTYGSIIQSIEPEHIADLPVPRLGKKVEQKADQLTEKAAANRTQSAALRAASLELLYAELGLLDPKQVYALAETLSSGLKRL